MQVKFLPHADVGRDLHVVGPVLGGKRRLRIVDLPDDMPAPRESALRQTATRPVQG
jgi:hypothetical protein